MNSQINSLTLLLSAIVATSALLLAVYIVFRPSKGKTTNVLFAIYLVSLSLGLAEPIYEHIIENEFVILLLGSYTFMLGPSLYLYCKQKTQPGILRWTNAVHLVPVVLYVFGISNGLNKTWDIEVLVYEGFLLHVVLYSYAAWRRSLKTGGNIKSGYDSTRWAHEFTKYLSFLTLSLFIILGCLVNSSLLLTISFLKPLMGAIQISFTLFILLMIFLTPEFNKPNDFLTH